MNLCNRYRSPNLIIFCCFLIYACNNNSTHHSATISGFTMGTTYTVQIINTQIQTSLPDVKRSIEEVLDNVNTAMSTYMPDSELSRLNISESTDWIELSGPLFKVIQTAQEISRMSNGAFDITIGPLVNLWGFGPIRQKNFPPSELIIESLLKNIGFKKIQLDNEKKRIRKEMPDIYIDLSAIAKGYAVDEIGRLLENNYSIQNYMVEVGGEILARGINDEGYVWRIGIEKPVSDKRTVERIIILENMALATSGNYRNYIDLDGVRYSHAIDPNTGKPTKHQLASVTVIHTHCMIADAWATALLISGPENGIQLAENYGLDALFIIQDKNKFVEKSTGNFDQYDSR